MKMKFVWAAAAAVLLAPPVQAASEQASEIALIRNTVENLLNAMVEEGLISRDAAERLIADAEAKAEAEMQALEAEQAVQEGDVRVTYVPQTVIDDISEEVARDVSDQVTDQVVERAAEEGWGVPGALPNWLLNGRFYGDARMRVVPVSFSSQNQPRTYLNYNNINRAGGAANLSDNEAFINTTEDDTAYALRLRFGAEFEPADTVTVGFRLATDRGVPISRNVRLDTGTQIDFGLDQAYINLHTRRDRDSNHWNLWVGRMANQYQYTGLMFDDDLVFDGVTVGYDQLNLAGDAGPRGLFGRASAYSLQQVDSRSKEVGVDDKYIYAIQAGYEWGFADLDAKLSLAAAFYYFDNVAGVKDTTPEASDQTPDGLTDESVPDFVRKGNTYFPVRNTSDINQQIFGLSSDFEVVNLNGRFVKIIRPNFNLDVSVDYVQNTGFDQDDIFDRTGVRIKELNQGYRVEVGLGAERFERWADWHVFAGWSYLQRDAVVDGFTDSNFNLGGTDHEGYFLGGSLGLARNTWLRARYLSFDEITGPRLGVDIFQLDLNTRF